MKTTTGIGLRQVRVALRDTDGTVKISGSPAVGTAYSGIQISGALALSVAVPDPQRVVARGDDRPYHTFQLPPTENPTGELRVSKTNLDAIALLTSTEEFGSAAVRRMGFATDKQGDEETLFVWGCREAIDSDEDSSTFGDRRWQTYMFLSCKAAIRPATMEDAAVGEFSYTLAANPSTVDEFGVTFTTATNGFTKAPILMVVTKYKFMIDAFEGDGLETDFTLSKGASLQTDSFIQVYIDGVVAAYTNTAGVLTFGSAPADGAKIIVEYDYLD